MPALVMYQSRDPDDETMMLQKVFGYVPYGDDFMVRVSPTMGDPIYWTYLMSVGAASFFGTNYYVVRAHDTDGLVKQVTNKLQSKTKYLLHGLPDKSADKNGKDCYTQTLVEFDSATSYARGRQLFGSFLSKFSSDDPAFKPKPVETPKVAETPDAIETPKVAEPKTNYLDSDSDDLLSQTEGSDDETEGSDDEAEGSDAEAEGSDAEAEGSDDEAEGSDDETEASDAEVPGAEVKDLGAEVKGLGAEVPGAEVPGAEVKGLGTEAESTPDEEGFVSAQGSPPKSI